MGNNSSELSRRRGGGAGNVYFRSSKEERCGCFVFNSVSALCDWRDGDMRIRELINELVFRGGYTAVCEAEE